MLKMTYRRPDIRKCALIAAMIAAGSIAALETAGVALTASYAGLDGTLAPPSAVRAPTMAPASSSLR